VVCRRGRPLHSRRSRLITASRTAAAARVRTPASAAVGKDGDATAVGLLGQRCFVGFDELHGDRVVAVDLATGWLGDLAPFGISGPGSVGALAGALLLWRARRLLITSPEAALDW